MTKAFEKMHAFKNYKEYFAKNFPSFWEGKGGDYTTRQEGFFENEKILN